MDHRSLLIEYRSLLIDSTDGGGRTSDNYECQNFGTFSRECPYISNTFSRESPNFRTSFHVSKQSPRHSKDLSGKLVHLEIQIFDVWSPLWMDRCILIFEHSDALDVLCAEISDNVDDEFVNAYVHTHVRTHWSALKCTPVGGCVGAEDCNTLDHAATHCNTLQYTAAHCSAKRRTATARCARGFVSAKDCDILQHAATHCNTLQHTTTHCNTLQHTAKHCEILQYTATYL